MNSAHAHAHSERHQPIRRHLTLVEPLPEATAPPRSAALGALLAGLSSGFVLAALAALFGGGSPAAALAMAAICLIAMAGALGQARRVTVRRRADRRAARRRTATAPQLGAAGPHTIERRAA